MPSLKLMLTTDIMDMLDTDMPLIHTATDTEPTGHTDTDTDMELTGVKNKTDKRNHSRLAEFSSFLVFFSQDRDGNLKQSYQA